MATQPQSLSGITNKWSSFGIGGPLVLTGRQMFEYDMGNIILRTIAERHSLKTNINTSDVGLISSSVRDALLDPENWWPGQEPPLLDVNIQINLIDDAINPGSLQLIIRYDVNPATIQLAQEGNTPFIFNFSEQT